MRDTRMRELYTSQMEIGGICAKMHRVECPSCITPTSHQADKSPKLNWATSSQEDMAPSNKPFQLIGTIIDSTPSELLTGEGNPGLP
jgi:hypothetical protein